MSRQKIADELNELCLALFDGWCERRCVIPLANLLHGWPLGLLSHQTGSAVRTSTNWLLPLETQST